MADRARARRQRPRGGTRVVDGEVAGPFVTGGHGDDHVGPVEVVDRVVEQESAAAVVARAAQAHVGDVEAVGIRLFERVEDVLRASAAGAGEHVVVAESAPGATPDGSYGMSTPSTTAGVWALQPRCRRRASRAS